MTALALLLATLAALLGGAFVVLVFMHLKLRANVEGVADERDNNQRGRIKAETDLAAVSIELQTTQARLAAARRIIAHAKRTELVGAPDDVLLDLVERMLSEEVADGTRRASAGFVHDRPLGDSLLAPGFETEADAANVTRDD